LFLNILNIPAYGFDIEVVMKEIGKGEALTVISGPCVIESEEHTMQAASHLVELFAQHPGVNFIFKSSYDKGNRTSVSSYRGPGLEEGLRILRRVRDTYDIPVLTDVHTPEEARIAGAVCDIIQIPAFLCRQTDLLVAAGETGCVVNIKKGQFLSPGEMKHAIEKVRSTGNTNIFVTERGTTFGYNNLVSDMRSIAIMQELGVPVCYDATHSVQLPGDSNGITGGQREFIPILARAAVASGCDAIFMESHPNPAEALCDKASLIAFKDLPPLLDLLEEMYALVHRYDKVKTCS
jgi:2-dehydro-3-deoxyphosphooctonate aldolase (KDO 8-P synthase)